MSVHSSGLSMWSRACQMLEEAERRHQRFYELMAVPARTPVWEPPVDVFVFEGGLHIVVALPGVRPENTLLELSTSGLTIRAQHALAAEVARSRILRMEIPYGRIERRIELPPGRYELLSREFIDGCLHIRLSGTWT